MLQGERHQLKVIFKAYSANPLNRTNPVGESDQLDLVYPRKYVVLHQFHWQKQAQHVSAAFCVSNTSPAVASVQRQIKHVFGIGQCPAIY